MQVEFSEELTPALKEKENELQIQAKFLPEKVVLDSYLHHAYGNAYDFSQEDPLKGYF